MLQLTAANFAKSIATGVVVVDFMTPSCKPCKPVGILLEHLSNLYPTVKFAIVDCEQETQLAERYGVNSVPTLIFFSTGQPTPYLYGSHCGQVEKVKAMLAKLGV